MNNFKELFNIENRTRYFVYLIFFLSIAAALIFGLLIVGENAMNKKVVKKDIYKKNDPFENINPEAKGVVVWDVINQREIFTKNPDLSLPLASLTKVMTVLVSELLISNESNTNVFITKEDLYPEGDSGLLIGDSWKISDLRDFTLVTSSNDGATALAGFTKFVNNEPIKEAGSRLLFIKKMNDVAEEIGLSNSYFFNEHGLDKNINMGGAYGSAKDMALLFEYILKNHPNTLEATRYKNLQLASMEKTYSADNTNDFVDKIPGIIASKTGYTDLAGGNLVIAYDAGINRPIIVSVLGSSEEGRFSDALRLVEASMRYIIHE